MKKAAGLRFMQPSPLLEKEMDIVHFAQSLDALNPFLQHGAGAVTTLAANDCPMYSTKVKVPKILQKRLD